MKSSAEPFTHKPSTHKPSHKPSHNQPDEKAPSRKIVLLSVAYSGFFLATLWAAYHNHLPLKWLSQFPNYDKVGHLVLYFIPSFLGHRFFRRKHWHVTLGPRTLPLPVFPVLFTLFTVVEELIQGLSPYRTLDSLDLACGLVGIVCGYVLAQSSQPRSV